MAPDVIPSPPRSPEEWVDPRAYNWKEYAYEPDISHLPTEDDSPLDNFFQAKQQRLLVEPLRSSWSGHPKGQPFLVDANIGIYASVNEPAVVPDVFLSLGIKPRDDYTQRENRSYFVWVMGKVPDVVVEIVSNKEGGEAGTKFERFTRMRIPYYVLFDPRQLLSPDVLRLLVLHGNGFVPLEGSWMESIGLGLRLWSGTFEGSQQTWIRWCDQDGNLIPTGAERAEQEKQRAETAEARSQILAAKLRELGVDPESLK